MRVAGAGSRGFKTRTTFFEAIGKKRSGVDSRQDLSQGLQSSRGRDVRGEFRVGALTHGKTLPKG
jgi:hypothetical protein